MRQALLLAILLLLPLASASDAQYDGKADFEMFCSGCHPDGGNAINPAKPLRKMEREANGIKTAADIVKIMRKPGKGMRTYTKRDISNQRARALAEYVLKTF
jgi:cytochrome c6